MHRDTNKTVLSATGLSKNFGGIRALHRVDLTVRDLEIVALIGPNGAGKTTFFNCITGIYSPTEGDINIDPPEGVKKRINGKKPNIITELGMARTFQNIRLFPSMTALENVMIGRHCRMKAGILGAFLRGPGTRREEEETIETSYQLLKKMGLERYVNEEARNLPYGMQRRLEIARALATEPFILLLDEPAAGMNPQETQALTELILKIRDEEQKAILLIEHDMKLVMNLSERIIVMEYGRKIAEGTPQQVRENPDVIRAYLGVEADA
ncbi:MAG: ABC transporter ATP-binding protein [Desulfovibrio sp.]|nr:MAG: ABC transporter ATP-binding protein [Desulfovibrio sp.]